MKSNYKHLGPFSDLSAAANRSHPVFPLASPGPETQKLVRQTLNFAPTAEVPQEVRIERQWQRDGIAGEEISWSVGYGPRTFAWLLRPSEAGTKKLPGMVALHDHGGFKYFGREKIAAGPDEATPLLRDFRRHYYGDRAYPNELARQGFAVLVPDTFLWGSRRFPLDVMTDEAPPEGADEIAFYNECCGAHEHVVEKYCAVLGTTLAGLVSYEDRVSTAYLSGREDVDGERIGCIGLSGGGARSALLQATCEQIRAAVIVGMMSTYEGLLDHNIVSHTWMFFPGQWGRYGDWPDLAACRAPSPLLVQYDEDDGLFTPEGMKAAHARLSEHYRDVGAPENYVGQFYPGPHKFDVEMQTAAFRWLSRQLQA